MTNTKNLLAAVDAAVTAGKAVMEVYQSDFAVQAKEDKSPLTAADQKAHEIIKASLMDFNLPLISEEGRGTAYEVRKAWRRLWMVDPLDGTKEFVKRNGEFTVNIALIRRPEAGRPGEPIAGWVYAPVLGVLYEGIDGFGARKIVNADSPQVRGERALPLEDVQEPPRIVASRSHRTP
jgi:3'(2'), 5'-bisphosphate nucleotidase